jgi:broad specificity phosphatase PhoE
MTLRVALISHAATGATRAARFPDDEPLDTHGTADAAAAEGGLRRIERVYAGPEVRCLQTAAALGLEAAADPALGDLDLGSWRGHTLADIAALAPAELSAWLADPDAASHGGETVSHLLERVASWLEALPAGPVRIAAVTHPGVVRAAVLHVLGAPPACFWRIDVTPLSQTWLSRHGGRWQLRETGHPLTPPTG